VDSSNQGPKDPPVQSDASAIRSGERHVGERRHNGAPGDQAPTERRRGDRREADRVSVEMWMEEVDGDNVAYRRTGDVSVGGVYFDGIVPSPIGTRLQLRIPVPGQEAEVRVQAEVVNLKPDGLGMGVKFLTFEGDGREVLGAFLGQSG
jgi:hypothetical protein